MDIVLNTNNKLKHQRCLLYKPILLLLFLLVYEFFSLSHEYLLILPTIFCTFSKDFTHIVYSLALVCLLLIYVTDISIYNFVLYYVSTCVIQAVYESTILKRKSSNYIRATFLNFFLLIFIIFCRYIENNIIAELTYLSLFLLFFLSNLFSFKSTNAFIFYINQLLVSFLFFTKVSVLPFTFVSSTLVIVSLILLLFNKLYMVEEKNFLIVSLFPLIHFLHHSLDNSQIIWIFFLLTFLQYMINKNELFFNVSGFRSPVPYFLFLLISIISDGYFSFLLFASVAPLFFYNNSSNKKFSSESISSVFIMLITLGGIYLG